jgi:cytochrome P450
MTASDMSLFPMPRRAPLEPPPEMMRRLREEPVSRVRLSNGQQAWLVTRYEDVRGALANSAISSDVRRPGFPRVAEAKATFNEGLLTHLDPPDHDVYRRMLAPEFMVKRVEALRSEVQDLVDALIDDMVLMGPPADLVASLAFPVPAKVTCALLGVPYEDRDFFVSCAEAFLSTTSSAEAAKVASGELMSYLRRLVADKGREPGEDLISRVAVEHVQSGALAEERLVEFAFLILVAGFDTTANMIALGMLTLLKHPDQWAELQSDPSRVPNAVAELLRYLTVPQQGRHRVAIEDVVIGGQLIRAGEGIILAQDTANWDGDVFPNPANFDIHRVGARQHLSFGYGVHLCLGASVARMELEIAYTTLGRRLPNLSLAIPIEEISFRNTTSVYGVDALPIRW